MKVNGSVGRQALSSLCFSLVILPLPYTLPLSHSTPTPGILSFRTIKEILIVNITQQKKQMTPLASTYLRL